MIEEKLERIAVALEKIARHQTRHQNGLGEYLDKHLKDTEPQTIPIIPHTPTQKEEELEEKKVAAPPVPPAPKKEDPVIQMSIDELNEALMVEFNRLGEDRTQIDNVIKKHGAPSLASLDPCKYSAVLEDVKKLG